MAAACLFFALLCGFFGYGGATDVVASIAQVLFFVFLAGFFASLIASLFRRGIGQ